ncbi:hypothetical protein N7474_002084 [Penicillium riverlandense]|uniref:uncharacterized protein n=1 Tax=Penicillium riverlandense TaxID=1903569 RepID=UPI0025468026|nr:uncharacterized protein N7474_002084 [Penicillium riverlandense]KAJ5833773.1 hypothetical protein N7474_002084 [Penicillium riverlandense]
MTTSAEEFTEIDRAIERASKEVLTATIKAIYRDIPSVKYALVGKLFVSEDCVPNVPEPGDSDTEGSEDDNDEESKGDNKSTPAAQTTTGSKRLRTRYAICENCDKEFDVTSNTSKSCFYHSDYNAPDYDAFVDHDEDCHGTIDSDEMRKEFPENFIYECCGRNLTEEPCENDWHREKATFKKPKIEYGQG